MSAQAPIDPLHYLDAQGVPLDGAPVGMLLAAQAARAPKRTALTMVDRDGKANDWSFAEAEAEASRWARKLAAIGVGHDDVVAVALPNCAEFVFATYAAWKLGAVPCLISWRLTPGEFAEVAALAQPACIVAAADLAQPGVPHLDPDDTDLSGLGSETLPPAAAASTKMVTSGGSSGRPKLIVDPIPAVWGADKRVFHRPPQGIVLLAGPAYHAAPFAYGVMCIAEGSHSIIMERFDPQLWIDLVGRYRPVFTPLVPTMMSRIMKLPPQVTDRLDCSSIRYLFHVSAPCPADVKRWWIAKAGAEAVLELYGGSERLGATYIRGDEWLRHPGSVGRALPGDEIIILDEDGRELPPGEVGEIYFRRAAGVGRFYAYVGSGTRIRGDLDSFGDCGWLDADGYLFIADRRTDTILVGGVNVFPAEVEAAVESLDAVLCCAVIGLPDADIGNRLHAIVELKADVTLPDDGLAFIAPAMTGLAPFKRPRSAEFTHERVRDDAGKVRRGALRAERLPG